MKLTGLIICSVVCVSLIAARDLNCVGKDDGHGCACDETRAGICVNNACECENLVRRKRGAPCTTHRQCGWCRGYCVGGYCSCGWPF